MLGDAPKESEAVGEEVLVGVVEDEPVSDGVGGADPDSDGVGGIDPVEDGVGGTDPVGELLGVLERVLAADGLGVEELLGGR